MKRRTANRALIVLGMLALATPWLSVGPASGRRYEKLQAREAAQPGSVPPEEWISSEMDGVEIAATVVLGGGIAWVILTCLVGAWTVSISGVRHLGISLGVTWLLVAAGLHAWMWLWP